MAKPFITQFIVSPTTITRGEQVVFAWATIDADTIHLTAKGAVANVGTWAYSPTATQTYTLTATNVDGTTTESLTVTVTEPQPPNGETYSLTFYTTPGVCTIHIIGGETKISNEEGYRKFYNLYPGAYTYEVSKEGYVTVEDGISIFGNRTVYVTLEEGEPEPPPTPPECPDFWVDPVGAVLCWVIRSIEAALGLVSGGLISLLADMKQWSAAFTTEFWNFLQDPIASIQTWMSGVFATIQSVTSQIATGITDWWNQTVIDVGIMITNAISGLQSWIDETYTNINDWWADAQTVWGTFWEERLTGLETWIDETATNINNWYQTNIQPIIDTINSGLEDAKTWILDFPTLLSTWWNDRVIDIGVWIADAQSGLSEFLDGFTGTIGDWWNDRVIDIGVWLADRDAEFNYWVENSLPGIVEDMFKLPEWLTGPLEAIGKFAQAIIDMLAGTYPKDEKIQTAEDKVKEHQDEINRILGET